MKFSHYVRGRRIVHFFSLQNYRRFFCLTDANIALTIANFISVIFFFVKSTKMFNVQVTSVFLCDENLLNSQLLKEIWPPTVKLFQPCFSFSAWVLFCESALLAFFLFRNIYAKIKKFCNFICRKVAIICDVVNEKTKFRHKHSEKLVNVVGIFLGIS